MATNQKRTNEKEGFAKSGRKSNSKRKMIIFAVEIIVILAMVNLFPVPIFHSANIQEA